MGVRPVVGWTLLFGLWYAAMGGASLAPLAAWTAVTGVWSVIAFAVVAITGWTQGEKDFFSWSVGGVVFLQTILLIVSHVFQRAPFLLFPGNPQYMAFWFCAGFYLALARISSGFSWKVWGAVALVSVLGIFLLPIRSGWLGLLVGVPVFCYAKFGIRGILATGLVLGIGLIAIPGPRFNQILKMDDPRSFKRLDIWQASIKAAAARPLMGWGPGQFENAYWCYSPPQNEEPVRHDMSTNRAHNDFLQIFVESGVGGGSLALMTLGLLWKSLPKAGSGPAWRGAWAGLAAFAMVNSPLVLPACGALVGGLAALALRVENPLETTSLSFRRGMKYLLVSVSALLGGGEFFVMLNESGAVPRSVFLDSVNEARVESLRVAADRQLHSNPPHVREAATELQSLLRWNPHRPELWRDWGHLLAEHGRPEDRGPALESYRRALSLRPYQALWWVEWARCLDRQGNKKATQEALQRALAAEPFYFSAFMGMGYSMWSQGRSAEALRWFEGLRRRTGGWPMAEATDSGYRHSILNVDQGSLERWIALCGKEK